MSAFARSRTGNKRRRLGFAVAASLLTLAAVSTAQTATAAVAAPTKTPTQSTAHATAKKDFWSKPVDVTLHNNTGAAITVNGQALASDASWHDQQDSGPDFPIVRADVAIPGFQKRELVAGNPAANQPYAAVNLYNINTVFKTNVFRHDFGDDTYVSQTDASSNDPSGKKLFWSIHEYQNDGLKNFDVNLFIMN
mgnify:FL=1